MNIDVLRKIAGKEEVDYQFLLSALSNYSRPRDKISEWLKSGDLIRVKKGLYIFGKNAALIPYSLEVLANLIYGPSAISLSYALSFYGLIPERVTTVTSITNKRDKIFNTPVGSFTYKYLNSAKYAIGIELITSKTNGFLIASPEKSLCDYIHLTDKKMMLSTLEEIENYLFHDLRIDKNVFQSLKSGDIANIGKIYQDERLILLANFIKKWNP